MKLTRNNVPISGSASKLKLPNVRSMKLGERLGTDPFLALFGINKVVRASAPEFAKATSNKINRYISHQQKRLVVLQQKGEYVKYWKLAMHLLKSSKAFRCLALRNVRPNWYKEVSWAEVQEWLIQLNGQCYRPRSTFKIIRTAIPKDSGGVRWINNPGEAQRMYLWEWNLFLTLFLNPGTHPSQHGHRMGKGSVSCWEELIKYIDAPYIAEYDLRKFHDSINRKYLAEALQRRGFPEDIIQSLIHLCSPYVLHADDSDPMKLKLIEGQKYHHYYRGVVQGSNIAAWLGLVVLEDLKLYDLEHGHIIAYADDGVAVGSSPKIMDELLAKMRPDSGVAVNPAKTGWIKYDGVWQKDLKLVGLKYQHSNDTLYASTHSGKDKVMSWSALPGKSPEDIEKAINAYRGDGRFAFAGSRNPNQYSTKTLTYRNGRPYLGMLTSLVWGSRAEGYVDVSDRSLRFTKDSMIGLIHKSGMAHWPLNLVNASSVAYVGLAMWLKSNANSRPLKKNKVTRDPTPTKVQPGGLIMPVKGMKTFRARIPCLPVGMDLVPSDTKGPTPELLSRGQRYDLLTESKAPTALGKYLIEHFPNHPDNKFLESVVQHPEFEAFWRKQVFYCPEVENTGPPLPPRPLNFKLPPGVLENNIRESQLTARSFWKKGAYPRIQFLASILYGAGGVPRP